MSENEEIQHSKSALSFAAQLSQQRAMRERQFARLTNLIRIGEAVAGTLPALEIAAANNLLLVGKKLGVTELPDPALENLAKLHGMKMIEDAERLTISSAVVLAHSIFEDLLHSAARLSFETNALWWRKIILTSSQSKYSLREITDKGFDELLARDATSFRGSWQKMPLLKKVDSFFSAHKPNKTSFGGEIAFHRASLAKIDELRHQIVHQTLFVGPSDEILDHIFKVIESGRFVLGLLAQPQWIGFDLDAFIACLSIASGLSNEESQTARSSSRHV